ncbi:MAG: hypothetical protein P9M00_09810 [Candidatus Tritonobacter lacicola]|nr:hypothetical protein [Candidatus Tritonobacter lacicola]
MREMRPSRNMGSDIRESAFFNIFNSMRVMGLSQTLFGDMLMPSFQCSILLDVRASGRSFNTRAGETAILGKLTLGRRRQALPNTPGEVEAGGILGRNSRKVMRLASRDGS